MPMQMTAAGIVAVAVAILRTRTSFSIIRAEFAGVGANLAVEVSGVNNYAWWGL